MAKTITMMDHAEEIRRKRKMSEEDERNTAAKLHAVKKIDWDHWFGILKGGEERAREMQEEARKARGKISHDVRERIKRVKK